MSNDKVTKILKTKKGRAHNKQVQTTFVFHEKETDTLATSKEDELIYTEIIEQKSSYSDVHAMFTESYLPRYKKIRRKVEKYLTDNGLQPKITIKASEIKGTKIIFDHQHLEVPFYRKLMLDSKLKDDDPEVLAYKILFLLEKIAKYTDNSSDGDMKIINGDIVESSILIGDYYRQFIVNEASRKSQTEKAVKCRTAVISELVRKTILNNPDASTKELWEIFKGSVLEDIRIDATEYSFDGIKYSLENDVRETKKTMKFDAFKKRVTKEKLRFGKN